jgi:NRPS condensation-like uncharacterized protein
MGDKLHDPDMKPNSSARPDGLLSRGHGILSAAQQRLWVLERLHPANPAHNVSYGLRLTGPLDLERFGWALRNVVQRYEILRTEFHSIEGVPQPVIVASTSPFLNVVGMESVSPDDRELRLSKLAREEVRQPFDLSRGPLLRASVWRLTPSEHVVLLVAHSIVCDEASLGVLLRQLALLYEAGPGAEIATVQEPMQYSEFISRHAIVSEEQISYWKRKLTGAPASIDLPIDRPRPPEQTFQGASQVFSIGSPLLEQSWNES